MLKQSIAAVATQAIVSISNFLTGAIVAHAVGIEAFGTYSLIWATIQIMLGLQHAIVLGPMVYTSRGGNNGTGRGYFSFQLAFAIAMGCLGAVVSAIIITAGNVTIAFQVGTTIVLIQVSEYFRRRLFLRLVPSRVLLLDLTHHALRLLLLCILFWAGLLSLSLVLWILALGSAVAALVAIYNENEGVTVEPFGDICRSSFKYGKWLLIESAAYYLSIPLFLFATAKILGNEHAGGLNAVISIMNMPNVIVLGVMNFAIPLARTELVRKGYDAFLRLYRGLGFGLFVIAVMIYISVAVCAATLLRVVFGPSFEAYSDIAGLVCIYYCLVIIDTVIASAFKLCGAPQYGARGRLLSAIVSVLLAYPLITTLELRGAALGLITAASMWLAAYANGLRAGALSRAAVTERLRTE